MEDLICSALAFNLDGGVLNFLDWAKIPLLLLNNSITDEVLVFLQKNEFYESSNKKELLFGIDYSLKTRIFVGCDENSLLNFFSFLKFNPVVSGKLILSTYKSKNFKAILNYLDSEEYKCSSEPIKKKITFLNIFKTIKSFFSSFILFLPCVKIFDFKSKALDCSPDENHRLLVFSLLYF